MGWPASAFRETQAFRRFDSFSCFPSSHPSFPSLHPSVEVDWVTMKCRKSGKQLRQTKMDQSLLHRTGAVAQLLEAPNQKSKHSICIWYLYIKSYLYSTIKVEATPPSPRGRWLIILVSEHRRENNVVFLSPTIENRRH